MMDAAFLRHRSLKMSWARRRPVPMMDLTEFTTLRSSLRTCAVAPRPDSDAAGQNALHVVCPLPCMNGGQCSSRNRCQCPPHFTGKFCQIAVGGKAQLPAPAEQPTDKASETYKHSVFTLQLMPDEHSLAKFIPGIPYSGGHRPRAAQLQPVINLHVRHPPEATVQIHRVSTVDGHLGEQKILAPVHKVNHYPPRTLPTSQKKLGRCFQETLPKTCSNPLPGLTKEEDCCGSVGASWGFNNCNKCRHQHCE
ncbi:latent-transforming growth factor beta-binding protein 3-like isoform X3 [Hypanus sabinus]|uniref:latent-transforming growth factor beta-binding protein 3-like isoform X3 n=1 Tax=Hypanus sabinus TaxID=79690 RepID=UPI0028C3AB14|nr:latent-transforming growth factor beta-binding protein 3-like isoform X3 [Hypanus sabinus]